MNLHYVAPDTEAISRLLQTVKTIAVVGLSPKSKRPSHQVASAMQTFGYRILPVRPAVNEVLGEKAYARLTNINDRIDLVNVFRAPEHVDAIVDDCIAMNIPAIWLQDGVINESAATRAQQAGLFVVMDRCIYRDYLKLL